MEKYQNKYRIPSARAAWWDYSWAGAYFITICTHQRAHFFGRIENGEMQLSPCGVYADVLWHEIPHHNQKVTLGAFVVMPNHVHGILILDGRNEETTINGLDSTVETLHATSLQPNEKNLQMAAISPKAKTISTIIRSYKSAVTKHANRLRFEFGWQARFHDHIIRNDKKFQLISDYIVNNPSNWSQDKFYTS